MINFILGVSICLNIIFISFIILLKNKLNSKIKKEDIEKYILNNFMECDLL